MKVSFMSFFRSDGLTYSITVVWRKAEREEKIMKTEQKERERRKRGMHKQRNQEMCSRVKVQVEKFKSQTIVS